MKRAIIFGEGGLNGAFSAGVAERLIRVLGPKYFSSYYGLSVGSTIAAFSASNQPDIILNTWKKHVHGFKLVRPYNILFGKRPLDLDYLIGLFNNGVAHLNIKTISNSSSKLNFAVVDYNTGKVFWKTPNPEDMFQLIKASCSLPVVRGPEKIGDQRFFDAAFVFGGIPDIKKIAQQHDEIVYVCNYSEGYDHTPFWKFFVNRAIPFWASLYWYPVSLKRVFFRRNEERQKSWQFMKNNSKFTIIRPDRRSSLGSSMDTNEDKLKGLIKEGNKKAEEYLRSINYRK